MIVFIAKIYYSSIVRVHRGIDLIPDQPTGLQAQLKDRVNCMDSQDQRAK